MLVLCLASLSVQVVEYRGISFLKPVGRVISSSLVEIYVCGEMLRLPISA